MLYRIKDRTYWQKVWLRFNAGDRDAFEEIYQEFVDVLYDFGLKISSNGELVQDAIHDLFINLYKYRKNLTTPEYLEYYLFKSLRRNIVRQLKKERQFSSINENESVEFKLKFDIEEQVFDQESNDIQLRSLQKLLADLDTNKRELLYLRFNSGLNYREIGDLLGIKPDTAKKQIYRLIDDLNKRFGKKLMELIYLFFQK